MTASVQNILSFIPRDRNIRVAEIGVRYGESTQVLLDTFANIEKYYAIDPFVPYEEYQADGFNKILETRGEEDVYESFKSKFRNYTHLEIIRKFSSEAHHLIGEEELDVCFIDGNHEYKYVYDDLKNYYPKIRPGGIICGDDYFMRHRDNDTLRTLEEGEYPCKMVYEAVQEFFNDDEHSAKIIEIGNHRGYPKTFVVIKDL